MKYYCYLKVAAMPVFAHLPKHMAGQRSFQTAGLRAVPDAPVSRRVHIHPIAVPTPSLHQSIHEHQRGRLAALQQHAALMERRIPERHGQGMA